MKRALPVAEGCIKGGTVMRGILALALLMIAVASGGAGTARAFVFVAEDLDTGSTDLVVLRTDPSDIWAGAAQLDDLSTTFLSYTNTPLTNADGVVFTSPLFIAFNSLSVDIGGHLFADMTLSVLTDPGDPLGVYSTEITFSECRRGPMGEAICVDKSPRLLSFTLVDPDAVPEPATLALFGSGLLGLALRRRVKA